MHKSIAFAALSLVSIPAWAGDSHNLTYEFKLLSETERSADGTVGVVPITRSNEVLATLALTHKAVKEHEATLTVETFNPTSAVDEGVVSLTVNVAPHNIPNGFNYPLALIGSADEIASMDLEIVDDELSGSIQVQFAFGHGLS
jgi:hypothetical protein